MSTTTLTPLRAPTREGPPAQGSPPGGPGSGAGSGPSGDGAHVAESAVAGAIRRAPGDRLALALLASCFAAFAALTWRKWGVPEIDAGAELTTADLIKHGAVAYRDVRYYYGPLGLYSLALAFKVFGTSFSTAFAFGLAQTGAILLAFYALARHWLTPPLAGLATGVLLAIGFSGTAFNFILPHTDSATFGVLFVLLMLLALTRERPLPAGIACGLVALTRPEFLAVAAGAAVAYVVATWRVQGRAAAWRCAGRLALPAVAIPLLVYGWFAEQAGLSRLLTENLWPVKFLHTGVKTEQSWTPLTPSSLLGLAARGLLYGGLLAALLASVSGWRKRDGIRRLLALWPLVAAVLAIALLDGALRAGGLLAGQRAAIELEARHLVLGMSVLPALGVAVGVYAVVRLARGQDSPLGRSWPADLALVVAAAGLGLRAYNAFTTEGSYAPYYAAPLVLLLGISHQRLAARWPRARPAAIGALALVGAGLAAYSLVGLYRHDTATVHTQRGSFVTTAAAAPALQAAIDRIDSTTRPGQPILAAPTDGGLYFMADRPPALYELTLLPGLLATPAEERAAVERMRREHVALAAVGARDLSIWGTPTFGVDYDPRIGAYLRGAVAATVTVGSLADPVGGTNPSRGFTIYRLR